MKSLIFAGLLAATSFVQAEELYSTDIKKGICSELEYELEDSHHVNQFDSSMCMASEFSVTKTLRDQATNEVTLLKIDYKINQPSLVVSGKAQAIRTFRVQSDGNIKKAWAASILKTNVNDQRDPAAILDLLFEDLEFGNGDAGISKKPASFTKADMIKDIEDALPDYDEEEDEDGCKYYTTTDDNSALSDLKQHTREIPEYIKELQEQGKVKGVVSRIYDEGESEYCSHYYFRILLEDGTYIYLDLDFTT
ncbi:MAG: hypothetical protein ACN6I6_00260 [bacterium]